MLNTSDVLLSYFSPWLALERRKIFSDSAPWRRQENLCFPYGYFYAQIITAFAIGLFFSSTVPLVTIASFMFIYMRHKVDCLNLLTYYRKEIDSNGKIISLTTNTILILILFY